MLAFSRMRWESAKRSRDGRRQPLGTAATRQAAMNVRLTRRPHALGSVLQFAASILLLAFAVGCAEQGEGERCDLANDNNDCAGDKIVCTSLRSLNRGTVGAVCCPESDPSANVCKRLSLDLGDDDSDDDSTADDTDDSTADDTDDSTPDAGDSTPDAATADDSTTTDDS